MLWTVEVPHPRHILDGGDVNRSPASGLARTVCYFQYFVNYLHFYRAMPHRVRLCHSILSVCLSVRLSVTFRYRDHIGWNSSKIISRPNTSLRLMRGLTPTRAIWCNGNTPKIRVEYGWGDSGTQKPAISQKRCKLGPRLLWRTNRKSYRRFRLVPKSQGWKIAPKKPPKSKI